MHMGNHILSWMRSRQCKKQRSQRQTELLQWPLPKWLLHKSAEILARNSRNTSMPGPLQSWHLHHLLRALTGPSHPEKHGKTISLSWPVNVSVEISRAAESAKSRLWLSYHCLFEHGKCVHASNVMQLSGAGWHIYRQLCSIQRVATLATDKMLLQAKCHSTLEVPRKSPPQNKISYYWKVFSMYSLHQNSFSTLIVCYCYQKQFHHTVTYTWDYDWLPKYKYIIA